MAYWQRQVTNTQRAHTCATSCRMVRQYLSCWLSIQWLSRYAPGGGGGGFIQCTSAELQYRKANNNVLQHASASWLSIQWLSRYAPGRGGRWWRSVYISNCSASAIAAHKAKKNIMRQRRWLSRYAPKGRGRHMRSCGTIMGSQ